MPSSQAASTVTATCHRREPAEYPRLLEDEVVRFVEALSHASEDSDVPTCPGWSVRQVGEHIGGLYRWAEAHVRTGSPTRISGRDLGLVIPKEFGEHPRWIEEGLSTLAAALRATDPDKELWAWGSDKRARFWGRRMLFETTIHRSDLELAVGRDPVVGTETAVDGVDEFLDNLPHAAYFAPDVEELRADDKRLRLRASDAGLDWTIRLRDDGFEWHHESSDDADATVSGAAGELLLFVYGRRSPGEMETDGDAGLLDVWVTNSRI